MIWATDSSLCALCHNVSFEPNGTSITLPDPSLLAVHTCGEMIAAGNNGAQLHVCINTCQSVDIRLWLCRTIEIQDRSRLIDYELFSLYAMALLLLAGAGECCALPAACACLPGAP